MDLIGGSPDVGQKQLHDAPVPDVSYTRRLAPRHTYNAGRYNDATKLLLMLPVFR